MAQQHVVSALVTKYRRLLGEFEHAERRVEPVVGLPAILSAAQGVVERKKEITGLLDAIETVIHLFDPKWDAGTISPIRPRKKRKNDKGEIGRLAYAVMRNNNNLPLTANQLARGVAKKLKLPGPDSREINKLSSAIHNFLKHQIEDTIDLHEGTPRRWSLKRFTPPDEVPVRGISSRRSAATLKIR